MYKAHDGSPWQQLPMLLISRSMTKPTKWPARPAKTQISMCIPKSNQSLRFSHEDTIGPYLPIKHTVKLWSDWAYAQVDLCLGWVHIWFCCGLVLFFFFFFLRQFLTLKSYAVYSQNRHVTTTYIVYITVLRVPKVCLRITNVPCTFRKIL